jgi:hypothetical protein
VLSSPDATIEVVPPLELPGRRTPPPPRCFVGVDLAQVSDYTAIAVAERLGAAREAAYHVRHLERIERGTSYPLIVARVAELARAPAIAERATLVVDGTGVGRAVIDLLRAERLRPRLVPVTITAGLEASREGLYWHVPKRDLVAAVQVALQTRRLKVGPALPAAELLTRELEAFQIKLSPAGHDSYGVWREGAHDDLVLAVALAVWAGEHGLGGQVTFT